MATNQSENDKPENTIRLLEKWRAGDKTAGEELFARVYDDLRRRARAYMAGERAGHTLQATALVHEAFIKLSNYRSQSWQNRAHFIAVAARAMRQILVDHARHKRSGKGGGGAIIVPLEGNENLSSDDSEKLLAVDEALERLADEDMQAARVFELRRFGGLTIEETAEALGISPITVSREQKFAEAWLKSKLGAAPKSDAD